MNAVPHDVFADTAFWLALVVRQDAHHTVAQEWASKLEGTITTTTAVLMETANALARPAWRAHAVRLIEHLRKRDDIAILDVDADLFELGWNLYAQRADKSWGLVDCVSFVVMQQQGLAAALTTDRHFEQAGYRALMLEM